MFVYIYIVCVCVCVSRIAQYYVIYIRVILHYMHVCLQHTMSMLFIGGLHEDQSIPENVFHVFCTCRNLFMETA